MNTNTTTKHTPGPWELDGPNDAHVASEDYHTVRAGCGFLAESKEHRKPGFRIAGNMSLADARPIKAAPELLAALRDANELLKQNGFDLNDVAHYGTERACDIVARIHSALAAGGAE